MTIKLNDLQFGLGTGYELSTQDGFETIPSMRGSVNTIPGVPGNEGGVLMIDYVTVRLSGRVMPARGLRGQDAINDVLRKVQVLKFNIDRSETYGSVTLLDNRDPENPKILRVRREGVPNFVPLNTRNSISGYSFDLQFRSLRGTWRDLEERTANITNDGAFFLSQFGGSTAPMHDLRLEFYGVSDNISFYSDFNGFNFERVINGSQLKIYCNTQVVEPHAAVDWLRLHKFSSYGYTNLMTLQPQVDAAGPLISVSGLGSGSVAIIGRRAFL